MSSEAVRSYLLGTLEEGEAASVEEKYFTDRNFFLFVQGVETALIEDYLSGRLAPSVKSHFEARYLSIPDLRHRGEEVRGRWVPAGVQCRQMNRPRAPLVGGVGVVCVGGAVFWLYRDLVGFKVLPPSRVPRPILATLALSPGVLKGEGASVPGLGPLSGRGK